MAKLKVLSRQHHAFLCLSRSWVSEWSKSLRCRPASHFLSLLSCCLSSFCWAVNCLPYLWTRFGVVFYPRAKKVHKPTYFNRKTHNGHTYIHTHTYIQTQPQTKTPLAPAMPARLSLTLRHSATRTNGWDKYICNTYVVICNFNQVLVSLLRTCMY